jgi:hypothetical protein
VFHQFLGKVRELADKGCARTGLDQAYGIMNRGRISAGFDLTMCTFFISTAGRHKNQHGKKMVHATYLLPVAPTLSVWRVQ